MKILLKNARIINGLNKAWENGWVMVDGSLITGAGDRFNIPSLSDNDLYFDCEGRTLMPGLIDCHVHLAVDQSASGEDIAKASDVSTTLRMAANAWQTLRKGVTTVRDMGAKDFIDIQVRNAINSGLIPGTRIVCSGHMICKRGGQGPEIGRQAEGAEEIRQAVSEQVTAGADVIKLMLTGGITSPDLQFDREELAAAVETAHKYGRRIAAHAMGREGTLAAVTAGFDSVEHGILDDGIIRRMLDKGTFLSPTLIPTVRKLEAGKNYGIPEGVLEKNRDFRKVQMSNIRLAHKAGIRIVMGTDAGSPGNCHGDNARELCQLVNCGLSPEAAIAAATSAAAELLGLAGEVGSIVPGKKADLLLINGNPLEDIGELCEPDRIFAVFKNGDIVAGAIMNRLHPASELADTKTV